MTDDCCNRDRLSNEIDRQLQVLLARGHVTDITLPKNLIFTLSEEDDGYLTVLSSLRNIVFNSRAIEDALKDPEKYGFPTKVLDYLWKIPTFSSPSLSFIQPDTMLEQQIAICSLWRRGNDVLELTSEAILWPNLSTWAGQQRSSIVVVRGSSQSTKSLGYLSCQVVNYLHVQKYATACILNNANLRGYFRNLGAEEVLRQIACQLLKTITTDLTISLLGEILQHFHDASTAKDWFCLLELMMQKLTFLVVVIDASVLEDHAKEAGLWIKEFNEMFQRAADTCIACTKVMILTNREIDIALEDCLQVHVGARANRILPGNSSRLAQTCMYTDFSLPFFIPIPTRMYPENDARQSLSLQNDSGMDIDEAEQQSKLNHQSCRGNRMNTSIKSRYIAPSPRLHSENTQMSSVKPHIEEADDTSGNSPRATSIEYRRRQEISVAIICALSWEADAVEVLCDKIYDIHAYDKAPGDANIYNVAQMGRHKVVILYLPATGKSNAAASAMSCLHSFPNIRLALLTGICGGIPSPYTNAEILLGDVIVSDRLVLYDFGRRFPEGFTRKDTVSDNARKPLPGIAAFLSKLKTRMGSDRLSTRMINHLKWLRTESQHGQWATYPGISNDVSFEATYHHKHQNGECGECSASARFACAAAREAHCASLGCDGQRTINRKRHEAILHHPKEIRLVEPAIHFGAYASGDIVMKSGEDRDEIGRREKVIAFEMEGAGIWDNGQ